jgi:hypothetical protein
MKRMVVLPQAMPSTIQTPYVIGRDRRAKLLEDARIRQEKLTCHL